MLHRSLRNTALALGLAGLLATSALTVAPAERAEAATLLATLEAEAMTSGGGCTGIEATRVVYYCNNDSTHTTYAFPQAGRYSIAVTGASTGNNTAGISVLVGGSRVAALSFTGTAYTEQTATFDVASAGSTQIRFLLETDNGQNDTLIDRYTLSYVGPTPQPPPAPNPPSTGAYTSGVYRNLFQEWDSTITNAAVTAKLNTYWTSLFTGTDDTKRLYYPDGSNANGAKAYIRDTGNGDVRSEGMSYGMMIAVQMNKKAEFDALWNWAKSNMQHQTGPRAGYFCWQANYSGSCMDNNPASDGEEYFATALFFAGHRWGNGSGIYNYTAEANAILDTMLHKEDMNGGVVESVTNMFNRTEKMIVFVPYASAALFSDPSYHLPAFYELWSRWATGWNGNQAADRQFWRDAAARSRQYFTQVTHPTTGLNPDYAEFNGSPNNTGGHGEFRFDAWRTSVNWAMDYAWFASNANAKTLTDRMQAFFASQGVNAYVNQYSLAGNPLSSDRSPGLIASNGAASLSATHARSWQFVEAQWNLEPPTGQYRYYDGLLSFMALLHSSGNFRIYHPSGSTPVTPDPGTVTDTQAPTVPANLRVTGSTATSVTLSWSASSDNVGVAGYTVSRGSTAAQGCIDVTATTCTATGLSAGTAYTFTVRARDAAGNTSAASTAVSVTTATSSTPSDPGTPSVPGTRDPYATIQAESYDSATGVSTASADGGTVVVFSGSGGQIRFTGVPFGSSGASGVEFRAGQAQPGVNVQVRIGSATASPACTVYPDGNGTYHLKSNSCWPRPTGTQDVYITTTGRVSLNSFAFRR